MEPKPKSIFKEFPTEFNVNILDSDFDFAISKVMELTELAPEQVIMGFFDLALMEDEVLRSKGFVILKPTSGPTRAFSFLNDEYIPPYPFEPKYPDQPTTFWRLQMRTGALIQADQLCQRHELAMEDFAYRAIAHGVDYTQRFENGEHLRLIQPSGKYITLPPFNDPRFFPNGQIPKE